MTENIEFKNLTQADFLHAQRLFNLHLNLCEDEQIKRGIIKEYNDCSPAGKTQVIMDFVNNLPAYLKLEFMNCGTIH